MKNKFAKHFAKIAAVMLALVFVLSMMPERVMASMVVTPLPGGYTEFYLGSQNGSRKLLRSFAAAVFLCAPDYVK